MKRRSQRAPFAIVVATVVPTLLSGLVGCADRAQPQTTECYPIDPLLDHPDNNGTQYCGIEAGGLPDPRFGYAETREVFIAVPLDEGPCDRCDTQRLEALLRAKVEEECDLPYELEPLCYAPGREGTNQACWVMGLYYSDCDKVTYPPR